MMILGLPWVSTQNITPRMILNCCLAAFKVYVRHAYKAYSLLAVDYEEGDGLDDGEAPHVVTWRFKLGQSDAPPLTPTLYVSC